MGLAEKRASEECKKTKFAELQQMMKTSLEADIPMEVDWDKISMRIEGQPNANTVMKEFFVSHFAEPLTQAVKSICADEMGKGALKKELKKVAMTSDADASAWSGGYKFDKGTLTMNMSWANSDDTQERIEGLTKLLESKL